MSARSLFNSGTFRLHSGGESSFKIDCDALTDEDLAALALQVARRWRFRSVYGVPRGGTRFAEALKPYALPCVELPRLIVDDVFTTGQSMNAARNSPWSTRNDDIGVVIFARQPTPDWIYSIFQLWNRRP